MRRKLPQGFNRRGSSNPLSMGAFSRRKDADPYAPIRDGAKQEVQGMANKPTERQKDAASWVLPHQDSITAIREGRAGVMDVADAALSLPGVALVKPFVKVVNKVRGGGKQVVNKIQNTGDTDMGVVKKVVEGIGSLVGEGSKRVTNRAKTATKKREESIGRRTPTPSPTGSTRSSAPMPKPDPKAAKPKKTATRPKNKRTMLDETVQTNTNTGRAPDGGRGGATTPTPTPLPNPRTSVSNIARVSRGEQTRQAGKFSKPTGAERVVGGVAGAVRRNPGKTALAAGATGALGGYMLGSEKNAKPSAGSQAGGTSVNTSPDGSNAGMDADLFDTPTGVTSGKRKKKSDPTEGGRYKSYSKDNNDFMYMTQKGYDEMMDDSSGEKAGGRPGRGKLKTQGMNKAGKRKAGFSGKGAGAALRGF